MKVGRLIGQLTQQQLKSVLTYNPETGQFVWTKNAPPKRVGKVAGSVGNGYRRIEIHGRNFTAHRLAWLYVHGVMPDIIDHINGDPDDNRIANLREATRSKNAANSRRPEHNTSGVKGVHLAADGMYVARVKREGVSHELGRYRTKEEAKAAYAAGANRLFGEFAHDGERAKPIFRKLKADSLHPLRKKFGPNDPRLMPIKPDQASWDVGKIDARALRKMRTEREKQEALQRFIDLEEKRQQKKLFYRNSWTNKIKSLKADSK